MNVTLIQCTQKPVETIATIASICYDSYPANGVVKHLYENGHHSVFEHVYFTFLIEGISRACSHQLVRHRHCAFTQRSQRYCDESEFEYVVPTSVKTVTYATHMQTVKAHHKHLRRLGVPAEDSRMVLPNACTTKLYMSCNLRELIHIANERLCRRAQWEIRELVGNMVALVPDELKFMLVPKCESGRIICKEAPCK